MKSPYDETMDVKTVALPTQVGDVYWVRIDKIESNYEHTDYVPNLVYVTGLFWDSLVDLWLETKRGVPCICSKVEAVSLIHKIWPEWSEGNCA